MSRLGKLPIKLPAGTTVKVENDFIIVKGVKGELKQKISDLIKFDISAEEVRLSVENKDNKKEKAFWGLYWSLVNNMVTGVNEGYQKQLEIVGVGYKAALAGQKLTLNVGFSHPVEFILPEGIKGEVKGSIITIAGIDKQSVGEVSAKIRKIKKPEPYKGKGIKYVDEVIRRKEGKTAGKE